MIRICEICHSEFAHPVQPGPYPRFCTRCRRFRKYASNNRRRMELRALTDAAKARPCVDCGIQYPAVAMDLDHVRGEKLFEIGKAENRGVSIEALQREISKCDVRCSNCHRIRHFHVQET